MTVSLFEDLFRLKVPLMMFSIQKVETWKNVLKMSYDPFETCGRCPL